jgi:hypothetical protein
MKKYRIFLDTNQIYNEKTILQDPKISLTDLFGKDLDNTCNFLLENKDSLKNAVVCIPDIVIQERIQQRMETINLLIENGNLGIEKLSTFGYITEKIKPKEDHRNILELSIEKFIKEKNIEIVSAPKIDSQFLIDRAVHKIKPFNEKGVGLKDSVIWLTIIEDAKNSDASSYLYCTNDGKAFNNKEVIDEFKKITKKEIYIVNGSLELQQKLDEIVPLHKELYERDEKIKNLIEKKIGTLMVYVNSNQSSSLGYSPLSLSLGVLNRYTADSVQSYNLADQSINWIGANQGSILGNSIYGQNQDASTIIGYDFSSIKIQNINEIGKDKYRVQVKIATSIKRSNDDDVFRIVYLGTYSNEKDFDLNIECSLEEDTVSVVSSF